MQSTTRMCRSFFNQPPLFAILLVLGLTQAAGGEPSQGPRYPSDLALGPGQEHLFTANSASRSISMIRISSGEVLHELHLGGAARPSQITAFLHNGREKVAVSDREAGKVYILSITGSATPRLELWQTLAAPGCPEGLQYAQGARTLAVACSKANRVLIFNPDTEKALGSIETVEGPRRLLSLEKSSPGQMAVTGRDSIGLLDLEKKTQLGAVAPARGRALNIQGLAFSRGNILLSHQVQPTEVAVDPQMIVWGLILANRVTSVPVSTIPAPDSKREKGEAPPEKKYIYGVGYQGGDPRHRIVPLDQRQRANGDPGKPALVPRPGAAGDLLLLPSGGTNRLVFIDTDEAYLPGTEPLSRQEALPSIEVGDRPVAVVCTADGRHAYVLCSLEDSIWEIDLSARKAQRTIRLGPGPKPTEVHLGAKIFFNSKRSNGGWYSCNSCHPEGGTRGHNFDTHADGDGLAKKAPDLHGSSRTPPWAWNGKFKTLQEQVSASLHSTMAVNQKASPRDVARVTAFLESLQPRPTIHVPESLGGNPEKGAALFQKAACATCHKPPLYTIPDLKDVGVFDEYDGYRDYNPPSLLGVGRRSRFLHDGRATSLRSIFTLHDKEKRHGKAHALTQDELSDLVAFLRTL
ncbi:MAG: cytochrome c peroxidase [Planctomycetota bacterium]|nr:cytochrome c peroxidase [Planctomycetota bacterium]